MSPFSVVEAVPVVGPLLAALGPVRLLLAVGLALLALVLVRQSRRLFVQRDGDAATAL